VVDALSLVSAGLGITLLPELALNKTSYPGLVGIPPNDPTAIFGVSAAIPTLGYRDGISQPPSRSDTCWAATGGRILRTAVGN
jgi:hypothetical protein